MRLSGEAAKKAKANIRRYRGNPRAFVLEVCKDVPDEWQGDVLDLLPTQPRLAMQACKGPGKSRLLAWIIWWFLYCHVKPNVVVLSITLDNLQTNLWKELSLIRTKTPVLERAFEQNSERIYEKSKPAHKLEWFCDARAFPSGSDPQEQKSTVAGLHNPDVMVVLDEAGDMPPGLLLAAEAIFANDVNAHLVMAGNPTSQAGALFEACVKRKHRYKVVPITGDPDDPKRSPRISLTESRALIEDYGRDNPYVMVNVLGQFPPVAADKLLGQFDIDAAKKRNAQPHVWNQEAKVWGLDIARHGDDASVLRKRQGVMCFGASTGGTRKWRIADTMVLAGEVANELKKDTPHALFIGVTGIGWGVYDRLVQLGWGKICIPVDEASGASEPKKFLNIRAEMWFNGSQWVKKFGCLPEGDVELHADLMAPSYEYRATGKQTKLVIQPNDQIKAELGRSPDEGTALMLTFAGTVAPPGLHEALVAEAEEQRGSFNAWEHLAGGR